MPRVSTFVGSIVDPALGAQAIVNASNPEVALGSGVSGAIREACGGVLYQQQVRKAWEDAFDEPLEPDDCLVTGGGTSALRTLHRAFAREFLDRVPPECPLVDTTLHSKVEVAIEPDGSLHRVGIVKTSGDLAFDFGVFNALRLGAPYPSTPSSIRSADGRVYMRWDLHRGESQCGTWNAEPYILSSTAGPVEHASTSPSRGRP